MGNINPIICQYIWVCLKNMEDLPSGTVICHIAIEHGHRNRGLVIFP